MKRILFIASCFLFSLALMIYNPQNAVAAAFDSASVRPGTHSINSSPLPILITVKTSSAATEDSFKVSIPSEYTKSATAANYTVSTSLLPSGVSAWPGISTATGVAGNDVTFPSGNLQTGITYGFYITGGVTSTPSSVSGAESLWTLTSLASGSSVDVTSVSVPVKTSSQVTVTGTVPPSSDQFSVSLSSDTATKVQQNKTIEFSITYSTDYPTNTPMTLQASWEKGKVGTSTTPSVDVATYLSGSAGQAYGSTTAVIDPNNRTITWQIPSISSSVGEQTVSFSLVTTSNYQGASQVSFDVTAAVTDPVTSLPATLTQTYQYQGQSSGSSSSSSSGSSSTATPTPTAASTTSETQVVNTSPAVEYVTIPILSNTEVMINAQLTQASAINILYGTSPDSLNQKIVSPSQESSHSVTIKNLQQKTIYYFKVQTVTGDQITSTSDLYTFTTANLAPIDLDKTLFNMSFNGIPLLSDTAAEAGINLVVPENQSYELSVKFPSEAVFKSVRASVAYDLASTVGAAYQVPLVNVGQNTYLVTFTALAPYGKYNLYLDTEDFVGNKQSLYVGTLIVAKPLTVLDASTNQPIEYASISIDRYNQQLQLFEEMDLINYGPIDRWQSDSKGIFSLALPKGRYNITVSAPGYLDTTVELVIDDQTTEYPQVKLEQINNIALMNFKYYSHSIVRWLDQLNPALAALLSSHRAFGLAAVLTTLVFIVGVIVTTAQKLHLSLHHLPQYVLHTNKITAKGKIVDAKTHQAIHGANIDFIDDSKTVLDSTVSNNKGTFYLRLSNQPTSVLVTEEGYMPKSFTIPDSYKNQSMLIKLSNGNTLQQTSQLFSKVLKLIFFSLIETALVAMVVILFLYYEHFSVTVVTALLIVAVANVIIWSLYFSSKTFAQPMIELASKVTSK